MSRGQVFRTGGGPMGMHERAHPARIRIPNGGAVVGPYSRPLEVVPMLGESIEVACERLAANAPGFMVFSGIRVEAEAGETEYVLHDRWLYKRAQGQPTTYTEALKQKEVREERADLPFAVFSTDPRVVSQAALKFEVTQESGKPFADAVRKLWKLAEEGHAPERDWYKEAHELSERIGRPWHETPQPTIVEALARASRENLVPLGYDHDGSRL